MRATKSFISITASANLQRFEIFIFALAFRQMVVVSSAAKAPNGISTALGVK
jgi:hypothetical protein